MTATRPFIPRPPGLPAWWAKPAKPEELEAVDRERREAGQRQQEQRMWEELARGEHCTTYGVNDAHCSVAARIGDFLKYKVMGWKEEKP